MGEALLETVGTAEDFRESGFTGKPDELVALLQYYQKTHGYLSEQGIRAIAGFLKVSEAHIYGVASFYAQFRFTRPAEQLIRTCQGTACHVQGGGQLSQEIHNLLGIGPGEITPDYRFEFQEVACLGCCAQAPVVEINGKIYGKMTPDGLRKVLREYEQL